MVILTRKCLNVFSKERSIQYSRFKMACALLVTMLVSSIENDRLHGYGLGPLYKSLQDGSRRTLP